MYQRECLHRNENRLIDTKCKNKISGKRGNKGLSEHLEWSEAFLIFEITAKVDWRRVQICAKNCLDTSSTRQ